MASKKGIKKRGANRPVRSTDQSSGTPTLPYTQTPGALRRFLAEVPKRPRPPRVNMDLLRSWGIRDTNANSIIRVLRAVDLIGSNSEPTPTYEEFMKLNTGPFALGAKVRQVYQKLFDASREPYKEDVDSLRNLFNIHSGGAPNTINFQIQTFKALADYSRFDGSAVEAGAAPQRSDAIAGSRPSGSETSGQTAIHIDLHIHLPENKSRRDYEYMFEDIARYIYGRSVGGNRDEHE
jgi:uncharacterized protein DUF5343